VGRAKDVQALGAWAGILGPVLFTAVFVLQEFHRRDEYSPIAETLSALETGPHGWIQQGNFILYGVLTMVFAVALDRGLRPSRGGWVGPVLLGLSGLGSILAAVFPLAENTAGVTHDPGGHVLAATFFFVTGSLALIALVPRLRLDEAWRGLATFAATAGFVALLGGVVLRLYAIPADAPLHDWTGLGQRVLVVAVVFPCRLALSVRLLRLSRNVVQTGSRSAP
jgi:hypothetical membrane protein